MDGQVVWDLPVFINVRDRLFGLKKLIAWLLDAGHNKIYILDNASSYPPLLKYYETLNKSESVHVLYLKRNLGPHALWNSGVLNVLRVQTPYVYTDSDILPEVSCPKNAVEFLLEILRQNPLLLKAGLGLGTNVASYVGEDLERERNEQRISMPLSENVYFGTVRTTFALYRNCYHNDDFFAAWTGGNLMARHLQWELDYNNLSEEDIYYMNHADARFSEVIRSQGMKKQSL